MMKEKRKKGEKENMGGGQLGDKTIFPLRYILGGKNITLKKREGGYIIVMKRHEDIPQVKMFNPNFYKNKSCHELYT